MQQYDSLYSLIKFSEQYRCNKVSSNTQNIAHSTLIINIHFDIMIITKILI